MTSLEMNFSDIFSLISVAIVQHNEKRMVVKAMPANFARKNRSLSTGLLRTADAVPDFISRASAVLDA